MDLVEQLITADQYTYSAADKERLFVPALSQRFRDHAARSAPFARFLETYRFSEPARLADFPPLPVRAFKDHELVTVDRTTIVRELRSSSTTGQSPSRIFLDKHTAQRQTRALTSILKSHIGSRRRPYLVLDSADAAQAGATLTARGAAIRGMEMFASETCYAFTGAGSEMALDLDRLRAFAAAHRDREIMIFGFTFIVWTEVVERLRAEGVRLALGGGTVLHGGGWKKLKDRQVSHQAFADGVAEWIGAPRVLDYYGMVEQVGSIFIDCEHGHKHAPNFASVRIVHPLDLSSVQPGEEGLIVTISLLPTSYPGNVLLTEDKARLVGIDSCACGRKDVAFVFTSRVERAELRGCGDILAQGSARP